MTTPPFSLFEVSWEVCNMVGGVHTVISTKAKTAVERLGDDYVAVGPWRLSESDRELPFDDEPGHEEFFGFQLGSDRKMARWDKIVEYFELLAKQSKKIKVENMGPSTEGNPFLHVIISSERNMADLEHLRGDK